jgi:isoleucyl-tRNA synthetase
MFRPLDDVQRFPDLEKSILAYWKEINAFRRSNELSEGRPEFVFFDGPPFATGLPHYGHILAGTIKDVVTRYAYQTGHHVPRIFGWDTHGLPVEHEIDKTHGINDRQQILDMGIDVYNELCRSIVLRYQEEWETIVERTGRWIDFRNASKTSPCGGCSKASGTAALSIEG